MSGRLIGLDGGQKPVLLVVECQNRMTNPKYRDHRE